MADPGSSRFASQPLSGSPLAAARLERFGAFSSLADFEWVKQLVGERLRLHRDEDGEWPAVLRAFVASELSYPRVATDAHERKAIALLDLIDSYMKATK